MSTSTAINNQATEQLTAIGCYMEMAASVITSVHDSLVSHYSDLDRHTEVRAEDYVAFLCAKNRIKTAATELRLLVENLRYYHRRRQEGRSEE
jgi:hypothetical protein